MGKAGKAKTKLVNGKRVDVKTGQTYTGGSSSSSSSSGSSSSSSSQLTSIQQQALEIQKAVDKLAEAEKKGMKTSSSTTVQDAETFLSSAPPPTEPLVKTPEAGQQNSLATPVTQPAEDTEEETAETEVTAPAITQNLAPGMSGPEVVALQSYLVQQGFSIPSIQNRKAQPGFYGDETRAAVEAWQRANNIIPDNPNDYGFFGPKSRSILGKASDSGVIKIGSETGDTEITTEAGESGFSSEVTELMAKWGLTPPSAAQSPITSYTDIYGKIYDDLGLSDVKETIKDLTDEYTELENKKIDEKSNINDGPWITEGVRVTRLRSLDEKYDDKLNGLNNRISVYEKLFEEGRQDARFAAQQVVNEVHRGQDLMQEALFKAIDLTEKAAAANKKPTGTSSMQEYEFAVSQGFKGSFLQYQGIVKNFADDGDEDSPGNIPSFDTFKKEFLATSQGKQFKATHSIPYVAAGSVDEDLEELYNKTIQFVGGPKLTATEKKKLEAGNMLTAPRQEQLQYLYPKGSGFNFEDF